MNSQKQVSSIQFSWSEYTHRNGEREKQVLLVGLVRAMYQIGPLYNKHFPLLLDTSFESWLRKAHQAVQSIHDKHMKLIANRTNIKDEIDILTNSISCQVFGIGP